MPCVCVRVQLQAVTTRPPATAAAAAATVVAAAATAAVAEATAAVVVAADAGTAVRVADDKPADNNSDQKRLGKPGCFFLSGRETAARGAKTEFILEPEATVPRLKHSKNYG